MVSQIGRKLRQIRGDLRQLKSTLKTEDTARCFILPIRACLQCLHTKEKYSF